MRVVIYGRSHRDDAQMASQMEEMRGYCKSQDHNVVREVTDCCSGSQIGDNMIGLLNEPVKEFEAIVIRDPSRISRNMVIMVEMVKMMTAKEIRFIFTEMPELNNMNSRFTS